MSDFNRDRWGRPLIPRGTVTVPYSRPSSLGKVLTDDTALSKWAQRMVVYGMSKNRSLQTLATSVKSPGDYKTLTEIASRAIDTAGGSTGTDHGTAVHACIEAILHGDEIEHYPDHVQAAAWRGLELLSDAGFTVMLAEQACVNDALETAGTFDLLCHTKDYQPVIVDTKTSKESAPKYSALSWAVQLACYAYSESLWDFDTQSRRDWQAPPSLEVAYVLHIPSDNLEAASIIPLDIEAGFRAAKLADTVKLVRKHKFIQAS